MPTLEEPRVIFDNPAGAGVAPLPVPISLNPLSWSVNGAQIGEAEDSDEGNVTTLQDKFAVRRFICELPYVDDLPGKYLALIFPQGQEHPRARFDSRYKGLVVFGYDEGTRISAAALAWHSAVIYRGIDELSTLGWVAEGEFSEEQVHRRRDESAAYTFADGATQGRLIGHHVYTPAVATDETADWEAQTAQGKTIKLKRTGAFKVLGFDKFRGVHRFSMVRVLQSLSFRQIRSVGGRVWRVNDTEFLTYPKGELAFSNFGWREVFGAIPNRPSNERQFEVRLQFAHNPDKWTPVLDVETFTDESGFESDVIYRGGGSADGLPVTVPSEPYRLTNMVQIFATLNTTAPRA